MRKNRKATKDAGPLLYSLLPECKDGSLRLVDGTSENNGRLEICQASVWGTICNFGWDRNDAIVACRQLGINATGIKFLSFSK